MFTSPDNSQQIELLVNQTTKKRLNSVYNNDIQQLFIDIAKKLDHNSIESLKNFIPIDEILYSIQEVEPQQIVQYIKQIVFFLSRAKLEFETRSNENDYEKIIQKLEAQIRVHIRVEQQQRLCIENQQAQLEEFKNDYDILLKNFQKMELSYTDCSQKLLELQKQLKHDLMPQRKGNSDHQKLPNEKPFQKGRLMSSSNLTNNNRSLSGEINQPKEKSNKKSESQKYNSQPPLNLQMLFIKTQQQQHKPLVPKRAQQKNTNSGIQQKSEIQAKQKEFLQLSYRGSGLAVSKLIY